MHRPFYDVVVVGAGLSGLRAATLVQRAGLSCVVLEARDRVGGKTLSLSASENRGMVDLGAAWINDTNQSEMYALAREFGFDLIQQRATGTVIHQAVDGTMTSYPYGSRPDSPADQEPGLQEFIKKLNDHVDRSDLMRPDRGPDAESLDSMTLKEWALKNFGAASAAMCDSLAAAFLGVEAEEVSALFLIDYIKSGTGLNNMISDQKHGGQYLRNRQGNQTFSVKLAQMLNPGTLKLRAPVAKITQTEDGNCVVHTVDGGASGCGRVIVSVPTTLYPTIVFEPALPPAKKALTESTALGYYAKTIFVFDSPWWREAGLSGSTTSEAGPIAFTRDTCSEDDGQFSITCFLVGDLGRRWSKFSVTERRRQVHTQFRVIFGSAEGVNNIPQPINVIEKEWIKDPWARGAPSPVMGPGVMTSDAGRVIRAPFGRIHFVGTETAYVWKGYMEGAVRSGMRGADEVIALSRKA